MKLENLILLNTLSNYYQIEMTFFSNLRELSLIEIQTINELQYIQEDDLYKIEKMIRMHQDLNINIEGIDVVFNLLQKINTLKSELVSVKNRLHLYEANLT